MTPDAIPHDVDVAARAGANVINDPGDAPDVTTTPGTEHDRPLDPERLVEAVKERYGRIAEGSVSGCCGPANACCGPSADAPDSVGHRTGDLVAVPEEANLGLGCGTPLDVLDLTPGEAALDLGSGGGLDAFLAARRVGPSGRVIGVDLTPAMVERARRSAADAGFTNVEFREGRLEALPVEDASVDAVTSNCVINLVPDKAAVFQEVARVLKPGGRLVISDIVLDSPLPPSVERDLLAYVGCVSGALQREEYFALVRQAGLDEVDILVDTDAVTKLAGAVPEDVRALAEANGTSAADLAGKVRSVTFRATKPRT